MTQQKTKYKADGRGCNARYPLMEDTLYSELLALRKKGRKVKTRGFKKHVQSN